MSDIRERDPGRLCVFCDAPYTARMIAWLGPEQPCACCDGKIMGHWPIKTAVVERVRPKEDLVCDSCGRTLYRAV